MDELLKDFLTETAEQIEAGGTQLVLLERDPSDAAMIASIFRLVHTCWSPPDRPSFELVKYKN